MVNLLLRFVPHYSCRLHEVLNWPMHVLLRAWRDSTPNNFSSWRAFLPLLVNGLLHLLQASNDCSSLLHYFILVLNEPYMSRFWGRNPFLQSMSSLPFIAHFGYKMCLHDSLLSRCLFSMISSPKNPLIYSIPCPGLKEFCLLWEPKFAPSISV